MSVDDDIGAVKYAMIKDSGSGHPFCYEELHDVTVLLRLWERC